MTKFKRYLGFSMICLLSNIAVISAQEVDPKPDFPLQFSVSHGIHDELVIYVTGDGGWNSFNQQMVQEFEHQGYGVVAFNSRKYFWSGKSPEDFARDIAQLTDYYLQGWKKSSVIFVGYSFGADVVSFVPNRLSTALQKKIKRIALISPSASTDFVIRLSDLVGETENLNRRYKVKPEIDQIEFPVVCSFGKEEVKVLKSSLKSRNNLTTIELPGDHRYNNDYSLLLKGIGL